MRFLAAFAALLSVTAAIPVNILSTRQDAPNTLTIQFDNTLDKDLYWYLTGTQTATGKKVFVQPDGNLIYAADQPAGPISGDIIDNKLSAGDAGLDLTLKDYISGGRIYFSEAPLVFSNNGGGVAEPSVSNTGDSAHGINWGFVEFSYDATNGVFINISYVDWVGLPIGLAMTATDKPDQNVAGLQSDSIDNICADLAAAASDGFPWDKLCVQDSNGNNLRVMSPNQYITLNPGAFAGYWTQYVNDVWNQYTAANPLQMTTSGDGPVTCHTEGDSMVCDKATPFSKPSDADIFSCNTGAFALPVTTDAHSRVASVLCAGFVRGTLLGDGGNAQPMAQANFYGAAAAGGASPNTWDHYAEIVHKWEPDHKGYAFAYDDQTAQGDGDASGAATAKFVTSLVLKVGGGN